MLRRVAAIVAVAALAGAASLAYADRTRTFRTKLSVDSAEVLPSGAIEVTGTVKSASRYCDSLRTVSLIDRQPDGRPVELAVGASGHPTGAWLLRTKRGVEVKGELVAHAGKSKIGIATITGDGTQTMRTVVCREARDGIELP
jgi:hypothetical protein